MNSAGRALVFTETNVQGQFLLVYSYEFHCSINNGFTVKLYPWYSGIFLVLLEHFFMINHQKHLVRVDEVSSCMYE